MGIFKIFKKKVSDAYIEEKLKEEKRRGADISQYFEDAAYLYPLAIEVIVIDHNSYACDRSDRSGQHRMLEIGLMSQSEINRLNHLSGYWADLMAKECGYLVIELASPYNGGMCPIFYPDDINVFQIEMLKEFNQKLKAYNISCDIEELKYSIDALDPETNEQIMDLDLLINKLEEKVKVRAKS